MKSRFTSLLAALFLPMLCHAIVNDVETVSSVTSDRTLSTPIDLTITAETNALTATIDIANDDAAVVFENLTPTDVINTYLSKILINGAAAANGTNCRVAIYRHGTMILPHGKSYAALTVFTDADFGGESRTFAQGARQASLGKFNNNIRSFKLKRGYMATFANHTDGTGYSHCYIADREDLELNLPATMAGRISMLRVFVWNWVSKKGCSDSRDESMMNTAHATWYYDWGAGRTSRTNHEYVPQRHNEGGNTNGSDQKPSYWKGAWESWANINASDETCTHVLGQNEPDNTSGQDEVYTYVTTIPDNPREHYSPTTLVSVAKEFLYSGKRIGTFACCNPNTGWVSEYVNYCRENNIRIDFVATHYYIGGQSPASCISQLKSLYNATGLPVWATEWNNGANWTSESGFNTDSEGWYTWGSGNDQYKNGVWLRDVLKRADSEPWLERLAVYNAVQSKRQITEGNSLTDGGKVWGSHLSTFAYDSKNGGINYFMPWTHHNPTDFDVTYDTKKKTATFTWKNPDTDMADSTVIEYKNGTKWVQVAVLPMSEEEERTYTMDVSEFEPAMYTFRLTNYDYDKNTRRASENPSITIAASNVIGSLQYGQLKIADTDAVVTDIEEQPRSPYVVMGMVTLKNSANGITNHLIKMNRNSFTFRFNPWQLPTPVAFKNAETANYIVLPADTIWQLSDDMMLISQKAGKVKNEVQVTFPKAFPEGVTPVVIAQQYSSSLSYAPVTVKVYDVTNTGFKAILVRQEGVTSAFNSQDVVYFAASPGQIPIGAGKLLTVGRDTQVPIGGSTRHQVFFKNEAGEDMHFVNPYIVAASQTNNYGKASVLRQYSVSSDDEGVYAAYIRRQTDATNTTVTDADLASLNGDHIGWFIISDDPNGSGDEAPIIVPTGIENVDLGRGFNVSIEGRAIYAEGKGLKAYTLNGIRVSFGKLLSPGIYIVTDGRRSMKVQVR